MHILYKIKEIEHFISIEKNKGKTIGFVPTMGALHQGHISLIEASKKDNDITVCSIFVNPTQFNNSSDLTHYPRTPDSDIKLLIDSKCDYLYMPDVDDVYPNLDEKTFDFGYLGLVLEGAHRPGHFNGVGQVVSILLEGIKPHKAYFGIKDFQQVMIVKQMVKQSHIPVEIISCPILREEDGLAMSSRNVRLSLDERKLASHIPKMMQEANLIAKKQSIENAKLFIQNFVSQFPIMKLDYYEICDVDTLEPISILSENKQSVALIALFVGNIRLIDNWLVK